MDCLFKCAEINTWRIGKLYFNEKMLNPRECFGSRFQDEKIKN
jgi:hypothetical protein